MILGTFGHANVTLRFVPDFTVTIGQDIAVPPLPSVIQFKEGENRKEVTIVFLADDLPEEEEKFVLELVSPSGGSLVDRERSSMEFVIVANDNVGGIISFKDGSSSKNAQEGEVSIFELDRTNPAMGTATVHWLIRGVNASQDFVATSGQAVFQTVYDIRVFQKSAFCIR